MPVAKIQEFVEWTVMRVQGGPPDRGHPSQVGRALRQLGIEHIPARWTVPADSGAAQRGFRCARGAS